MRELKFITGHVIYKPGLYYKFQLKTTQGTLLQILQVVVQAQVVLLPQLLQTELIIRRKKFNLPKKF